MPINKKAPHQAVISVICHIHERDELGRCKANVAYKDSNIYTFIGKDYEDALTQANQFLERLKNDNTQESTS